ncbi:MAG: hypothetical protein MJ212_04260 [Alphaproteobacteria bacterium]|nr:hypothetical protein [Alphaproteobacteria bacterium]
METSKTFFQVSGALFTLALLTIASIISVRLFSAIGNWAGITCLIGGFAISALFAVVISTWTEVMGTSRTSKILCAISLFGTLPLIIGCYGLATMTSKFSNGCLYVGVVLFVAPILIAAIWGFAIYCKKLIN